MSFLLLLFVISLSFVYHFAFISFSCVLHLKIHIE
jgi:hypothetical protein